MLSVVMVIDGKSYDKAFSEARQKYQSRQSALGSITENLIKGVFKSSASATEISGKADIINIKRARVAGIFRYLYGAQSPVTKSLVAQLKETAYLDIEAKGTEKTIGKGSTKITQASPSLRQVADKDYVERIRILTVEIIRLGVLRDKAGKTEKINKLFQEVLNESTDLKPAEVRQEIYKIIGSKALLNKTYFNILQNPSTKKKFLNGPFGALIKEKARNLTAQVNVDYKGKKIRLFQTFINLDFNDGDIYAKKSGTAYRFYFTTAFEKKLLEETRRKLESNALALVTYEGQEAFSLKGKTSLQSILGVEDSINNILKDINFNVKVPSGGSIPLNIGTDPSDLFAGVTEELPKAFYMNLLKANNIPKGRFISAPALTSILQTTVMSRMRKFGSATPPTMTIRSGRFVEDLQVVYVNYQKSIANYYLNPIYYTNEAYGYEVSELVEGSLRDIFQNLYSRQFNLVSS